MDFKSGIFVESKSGKDTSLSASVFILSNLGIVAEKDYWMNVMFWFFQHRRQSTVNMTAQPNLRPISTFSDANRTRNPEVTAAFLRI